jgi:hypothetical protein
MVQEVKSPVKNLVRQRYAEGFNSGVKGFTTEERAILHVLQRIKIPPGIKIRSSNQ